AVLELNALGCSAACNRAAPAPIWTSIATGILLALVMFSNVWFVIWPNQKRVIANAQSIVSGGPADPTAAANARRAFLASRTNTLFSIPMLFFMAATSHFAPFHTSATSGKRGAFLGIVVVATAVLELNALGVLGGVQPGGTRAYLDRLRDTIIAGFVYAAVLIILFEAFFS
ncbi:MAG: urate hydroxylase PuuD, partial [Acidimicrobiia bacterium]|nr:urate hydroxylase PuuD [Acidimicrobiia bacterium]